MSFCRTPFAAGRSFPTKMRIGNRNWGWGVPGRGVFAIVDSSCVLFARKSAMAREFLPKIDTSHAIATSGLRTTNLLMQEPPFRKPPIQYSPEEKRSDDKVCETKNGESKTKKKVMPWLVLGHFSSNFWLSSGYVSGVQISGLSNVWPHTQGLSGIYTAAGQGFIPFGAPTLLGSEKSDRSFSDRSFFMDVRAGCPCQNSSFSRIWRA